MIEGNGENPLGNGGWIRTIECRSQSPMPCRLATPSYISRVFIRRSAIGIFEGGYDKSSAYGRHTWSLS